VLALSPTNDYLLEKQIEIWLVHRLCRSRKNKLWTDTLFFEAALYGFSQNDLYAAKKKLGVSAYEQDGKWYWSLPKDGKWAQKIPDQFGDIKNPSEFISKARRRVVQRVTNMERNLNKLMEES